MSGIEQLLNCHTSYAPLVFRWTVSNDFINRLCLFYPHLHLRKYQTNSQFVTDAGHKEVFEDRTWFEYISNVYPFPSNTLLRTYVPINKMAFKTKFWKDC